MGEFWRRMKYLLNRRRLDRELEEEMAFHREMAARAGAERKSFGNTLLLREQSREAWGWTSGSALNFCMPDQDMAAPAFRRIHRL